MSYSTVVRDIEQRLVDNWATTRIDINPNAPFKTSDGEEFVKLRVYNESSSRKTIGATGVHRQNGTIIIQIYTNLAEGTRKGIGYGDTLAALFRDQQFNGITCREALVEDIGEFEGRWQTNLVIPFYWDGTYSV